jgi:hypothetical protein
MAIIKKKDIKKFKVESKKPIEELIDSDGSEISGDKPEFVNGIENLKFIDDNQELIQYLLADLFPTALTDNEIKAVTLPFYDITFSLNRTFEQGRDALKMEYIEQRVKL